MKKLLLISLAALLFSCNGSEDKPGTPLDGYNLPATTADITWKSRRTDVVNAIATGYTVNTIDASHITVAPASSSSEEVWHYYFSDKKLLRVIWSRFYPEEELATIQTELEEALGTPLGDNNGKVYLYRNSLHWVRYEYNTSREMYHVQVSYYEDTPEIREDLIGS